MAGLLGFVGWVVLVGPGFGRGGGCEDGREGLVDGGGGRAKAEARRGCADSLKAARLRPSFSF